MQSMRFLKFIWIHTPLPTWFLIKGKVTPFGVRFLSDGYEFSAMEDATDAKGFKLIYNQVDC